MHISRTRGAVWCWGGNGSGQLGDGSTTSRGTPRVVGGLAPTKALVANTRHSHSRMGLPGTRWTTPKASAFGGGLVDFAMSDGHLCALASNGTIRCAGDNGSGESGPAPFTRKDTPTLITE